VNLLSHKVIVIGYGSIGKRHVDTLKSLGNEVRIVSRHTNSENCFSNLAAAMNGFDTELIVIATETHRHQENVQELLMTEYRNMLLIEKPLAIQIAPFLLKNFSFVAVGYNLRFHPVLQALYKIPDIKKAMQVHVSMSRYLPTMRGRGDYRDSYSASKSKGGGVLRDFSHELEYILYFWGDWKRVTALGGKLSNLEIDSDDNISVLLENQLGTIITLNLSYCDRNPQRTVRILCSNSNYTADLDQFTLTINNRLEKFEGDYQKTYEVMHLSIFSENSYNTCSYGEAQKVDELIESIEKSIKTRQWIYSDE